MQDVVEMGRAAQDERRNDLNALFRGAIRLTLEMVFAIFQAPGLCESKKLLAAFKARWHKDLPEAVEVLERGFRAATQFYAFPEAHWPRLRTTNGLERLHGEIKRRIKAAGAFPDGVTVATSTCPSSKRRRSLRQLSRSTEELRSVFYTEIGT
jgi:transposase-like protein